MNLGEALSLLKKERSRLARLISIRKENIFVEKGKKSEFNPSDISKQIDSKTEEIRKLKIKIQKTNLSANIGVENIVLAEAIIKLNDIRGKIGDLSRLFENKRNSWFLDKDQKEMVAQIDESVIEDEIENLENEKAKLDNAIQMTNWRAQLSD